MPRPSAWSRTCVHLIDPLATSFETETVQPLLYYSHICTVRVMLTGETRQDALARVGRALADPTRCRILTELLEGTQYPGQLATKLGLSRSKVSNHLACLRGCGLVLATYQGRQVRYELADAHLAEALRELVKVVLAVEPTLVCGDEGGSPDAAPIAAEQVQAP